MISSDAITNKIDFKAIIETIKYKKAYYIDHPDYFVPDGLCVFEGAQGSGKTLSAVRYVCNLMKLFPRCVLVSNIKISDYPFDNKRVFYFRDADDLMKHENGEFGVVYLIDEIQLYFNSLESKNVSMEQITEISQQRKQRKHIVCTSQVFGRLAKPLREQFNTVIHCRNYFGCLQWDNVYRQEDIKMDSEYMHIEGRAYKKFIFIQTVHDYQNYDTYFKVKNIQLADIKGGKGKDIYDCGISTERFKPVSEHN
jgi:hypothetical protein